MTASDSDWYNEWQRVVQQVATDNNEWQRVTKIDNELQKMTMSDNEWQRVIKQMNNNESK